MEMNDKKRLRIVVEHPLLYPKDFLFQFEDGWLDLIEELSDNLEAQIEAFMERFPGDEVPICTKAKSQHGILAYSMALGTVAMWQKIDQAIELSKKTCEICGKWGTPVGKPLRTRCKEHQNV